MGLQPGTAYHYSIVAVNQEGGGRTTVKNRRSRPLRAHRLPSLPVGPAASAELGRRSTGTVTTNGLQTNYGFEIGTEPGDYGPAMGLGSIGAGTTAEAVSLALRDLQPGTTYYYRLVATNVDGTTYGEDETFTTPVYSNPIVQPFTLPLLAIPNIAFPEETTGRRGTTALTNAQKLVKALKACEKRPRSKRAGCERQARRKYGPVRKRTKA